RVAQAERDPEDTQLTTFADEFDRLLDNEPKVGLVALRAWHIPMMGHGSQTEGGDKDQLAIIGFDQKIRGNNDFFQTPSYVNDFPGLQRHIDRLDLRDGTKDGDRRDNDIAEHHDNPAWAGYQTDVILQMLKREGYGEDAVTDLFFTNYKMTDIVGHQFSMDSERMADVLEAQDRALGRLVTYLDEEVGDYAIVMTADHGHTPPPERSGAWPISQDELEKDLNERFNVPEDETLKLAITAVGPFLDREVLEGSGVSVEQVARFMNSYTISDNWPREDLPEGYEDRGEETVFEAAFPSTQLGEVLRCRFGSDTPPGEIP
ncbi:MAG: alkaline phosphatase family protein, partial [Actinomycetota bacterium]